MPYTIESDKSRQIKWVVREDTDVSLTITVTQNASPYNLSSYTFIAEVFKIGGTSPILTLTQGSGITNNGAAGTLVLALTDTQLNITPNEYYWRLRTTAPTDNVWFNGIFQVNGYLHDSIESNSVSVELTLGGDSVAVSLTLGGGTGGGVTSVSFTGGIISVGTPTTTPALTVAGTSGGVPYFSSASTWASSGLLAANSLMVGGGVGAAPSTVTTGTGVLTFLATPSWTNFNSMITGTAPFWNTGGATTLTSANTISGTYALNLNTSTVNINSTGNSNWDFGTGSLFAYSGGASMYMDNVNGVEFTAPSTSDAKVYINTSGFLVTTSNSKLVSLQSGSNATNLITFNLQGGTTPTATLTAGASVTTFGGLKYGADYSSNFTSRSLVDKAYVDGAITTAGGAYRGLNGTYTATGTVTDAYGSNPYIFTSGVTTGTDATSGADYQFNSLTTGYGLNLRSSSVTSGRVLRVESTSTSINHISGTSALGSFISSGLNANASRTAVGLQSLVTNTGTTNTNVGAYISASGATNNYGLIVQGQTIVNGATPSATALTSFEARGLAGSTTNQIFRFTDDAGVERLTLTNAGQFNLVSTRRFNSFSITHTAGASDQYSFGFLGTLTGSATANESANYLSASYTINSGNTGQTLRSQYHFPIFNANHSNAVLVGYSYSPTVSGTQVASATHIAWLVASGSMLLGTTTLGANTTRMEQWGIGITTGINAVWKNSAGTEKLKLLDNGQLTTSGNFRETQGADVASVAGAITLGTDGNTFEITGTNAITLISNTNWQNGSKITLLFTSTATLTDGIANSGTDIGMELAGGVNFTGSADDTVTLVLSEIGGTQRWREICRSVN